MEIVCRRTLGIEDLFLMARWWRKLSFYSDRVKATLLVYCLLSGKIDSVLVVIYRPENVR